MGIPVAVLSRARRAADAFRRLTGVDGRRRRTPRRPGRAARAVTAGPDLGGRSHPADAQRRRLVRADAVATRRRRRRARAARVRRGRRRSVAGRAALGRRQHAPPTSPRGPACSVYRSPPSVKRAPRHRGSRRWAPRPHRAARSGLSGRRPVLDVGRPAVRSTAGAGRRHRRQGRNRSAARRHPLRAVGVLRLDEQRKAFVRSRFRRTSRPTAAARGRRRRHRVVAARGTGTPWPRRRPTSRHATAGCGCGSPATAPTASGPTGWPSATTPRCPAGWSAAADGEPGVLRRRDRRPVDRPARRAFGVAESLSRGGGELIELSMAAVAATYAAMTAPAETRCAATPAPPVPASELGADNAAVERLLAERRLASC